MVYLLAGHVLILVGIFFAFLASGISFHYAKLIKGGAVGRASMLNSIGFLILAISIFLMYGMAITGNLNLLTVGFLWPLLGVMISLGFGIIAYAQLSILRVMGRRF
jgi:hypothetical protein